MMQKRNFRKVFLIGVFIILFLLLLGGNVQAQNDGDNSEDNGTMYIDLPGLRMDWGPPNLNATYEQVSYKGATWTAIVKVKATEVPNKIGVMYLKLNTITGGEVQIPNRVVCKGSTVNYEYGVVLDETSFASTTNKDTMVTLKLPNSNIMIIEGEKIDENGEKITMPTYSNILSNFTKDCGKLSNIIGYVSNSNPYTDSDEYKAGATYKNTERSFKFDKGVLFNSSKDELICYPRQKTAAAENNIYKIPDGVKVIGENAFFGTQIRTVELPSSITTIKSNAFDKGIINTLNMEKANGLTTIGYRAFAETNLTNVTFPSSVTTLGKSIFSGCDYLCSVAFNDGVKMGTPAVLPGEIFNGCKSITNVDLGNRFDIIGENAFAGCSSLININMESVTEIGASAFSLCTSLRNIDLSKITKIGNFAFAGCKVLGVNSNDIKTPIPLDLSKITAIGESTFSGCISLSKVNFYNTDSSTQLQTIGNNAFSGTGLIDLEIPLTVSSIGAGAFSNCKSLKNLVLPDATVGGNAFSGCVPDQLVVYCTESSEPSVSNLGTTYIVYEIQDERAFIKKVKVNNKDGKIDLLSKIYGFPVTTICEGAFSGCTKMTSIILPSSLTTIEKQAFMGCTGLTTITIPKSVRSIGEEAFKGCKNLKKVMIEKGSELYFIGERAFEGCHSELVIYYSGTNQTIIDYPGITSVGDNTIPTIEAYVKIVPSGATITGAIVDRGVGIKRYIITSEMNPEVIPDEQWIPVPEDQYLTFKSSRISENGITYIHAMDLLGNYATYLINIEGIDKIKPTIKNINSKSANGVATLSIVLEDEGGSNLARYAISTSPLAENVTGWRAIPGNKSSATVEWQLSKNGKYYIYVEDGAGNITCSGSSNSGIGGGIIDFELWDLDLYSPWIQELVVYVETGEIFADIRDLGSGLAAWAINEEEEIADDSDEWQKISKNTFEYNIEKTIEVAGQYYLHIIDCQGNKVSKKIQYMNTTDRTAPRIVFGGKLDNKVKVILEDASGIAGGAEINYGYSSSSGEPTSYRSAVVNYDNNETYFYADGSNSFEGDYYLYVQVKSLKDNEGNLFDTTKTKYVRSPETYRFSRTKLKISSVTLDKKLVKEGDVATYNVQFSEPVELVKDFEAEKVSSSNAQYNATYSGSEYSWKIEVTAGVGNGEIQLRIPIGMFRSKITENTFARSITLTDIITVDNDRPEVFFENIDKSYVKEGGRVVYTITTNELVKVSKNEIGDISLEPESQEYIMYNIATVERAQDDAQTKGEYGTKWLITVEGGEGDGDVFLRLPDGLFRDMVDNYSEEQEIREGNLKFDNTSPEVASLSEPTSDFVKENTVFINKDTELELDLNMNESVQYINNNSIKILVNNSNEVNSMVNDKNETVEKVTVTPTNYSYEENSFDTSFKINIQGISKTGKIKITIPKECFKDFAGNVLNKDIVIEEKLKDGKIVKGFEADNQAPNIGTIKQTPNNKDIVTEMTLNIKTSDAGIGLDKYVLSKENYDITKPEQLQLLEKEKWNTITDQEINNGEIETIVKIRGTYYLYIKDRFGNLNKSNSIVVAIVDIVKPKVKTIVTPEIKDINKLTAVTFEVTMNEPIQIYDLKTVKVKVGSTAFKDITATTIQSSFNVTSSPIVLITKDASDSNKIYVSVKGLTGDGDVTIKVPANNIVDYAEDTYPENSVNKKNNPMEEDIELKGITMDNTPATMESGEIEKTIFNVSTTEIYNLTMSEEVRFNDKEMIVEPLSQLPTIPEELTREDSTTGQKPLTRVIPIQINGLSGNGDVRITIPKGFFIDKVGNETEEIVITELKSDNLGPIVSEVTSVEPLLANKAGKIVCNFETDEIATLVEGKAPIITNLAGTKIPCDISIKSKDSESAKKGAIWEITLTNCEYTGQVNLKLPEELFIDDIGNMSKAMIIEIPKDEDGNARALVFDNKLPEIKSITPEGSTTVNSTTKLNYTVEVSERINYLPTTDKIEVLVNGKKKDSVAVSVTEKPTDEDAPETIYYNVTLTVEGLTGNGTATVKIPKGYFKDLAGNILKNDVTLGNKLVDGVIIVDNTQPTLSLMELNTIEKENGEIIEVNKGQSEVCINKETELTYKITIDEPIICKTPDNKTKTITAKVNSKLYADVVTISNLDEQDGEFITTFTVTVKGLDAQSGDATITIPKEYIIDKAGNTLKENIIIGGTGDHKISVDNTKPTLESSSISINKINYSSKGIYYTITMSEPVTFDYQTKNQDKDAISQVKLTATDSNGSKAETVTKKIEVENLNEEKTLFSILIDDGIKDIKTIRETKQQAPFNGTVKVTIPEGFFTDVAGNSIEEIVIDNLLTVDNSGPELKEVKSVDPILVNNTKPVEYIFTTTESAFKDANILPMVIDANTLKSSEDLKCEDISISSIDNGTTWKVILTGCKGTGNVKLKLPVGLFTDDLGNKSPEAIINVPDLSTETNRMLRFDNTAPEIESITPEGTKIVNSTTVLTYDVIMSEPIRSIVTNADVQLIINNSKVAATVNLVTNALAQNKGKLIIEVKEIDSNANGDATIEIPKELFKDFAGNTLNADIKIGAKETDKITVDNLGPVISLEKVEPTITNKVKPVIYTLKTNEKATLQDTRTSEMKINVKSTEGTISPYCSKIEIASASSDQKTWKVTVFGCNGTGNVELYLPDGLFTDDLGNKSLETTIKLPETNGKENFVKFDNINPTTRIEGEQASLVKSSSDPLVYTIIMDEQVNVKNGSVKVIVGDKEIYDASIDITLDSAKTRAIVEIRNLTGNGEATITIPKSYFEDLAGNQLKEDIVIGGTTNNKITVDNLGPKVSQVTSVTPLLVNSSTPVSYVFKTNEKAIKDANILPEIVPIINIGETDLKCDEISINPIDGGTTWKVMLTGCKGSGDIRLKLPAGLFTDSLGNKSLERIIDVPDTENEINRVVRFDNIAPEIKSITPEEPISANLKTTLTYTAEMSELVKEQDISNKVQVIIDNNPVNATVVIKPIYSEADNTKTKIAKITITVNGLVGNGEATIKISKDLFHDFAGNTLKEDIVIGGKDGDKITVDNLSPRIEKISKPSAEIAKASDSEITYTIDMSEKVFVNQGEVKATVGGVECKEAKVKITLDSVTNATKTIVTASLENLTGNGAAKVIIPAGYFKDLAGNLLNENIELTGITVDNTKPTITVEYSKVPEGFVATLKANERIQVPESCEKVDDCSAKRTFNTDFGERAQITVIDLAGNSTIVNIVNITGISILKEEKDDGEIVVNKTKELKLSVTPTDAPLEDIEWISTNKNVASVDSNGKITAKSIGTATITARSKVNGRSTSYEVKVVPRAIKSISVLEKPLKLEYVEGQKLDLTGGRLTLNYNDSTIGTISMQMAGVTSTALDGSIGKQTITITYQGLTTTFDTTVIEKVLEEIKIKNLPTLKQYIQNKESLNLTGGILQLSYNDKTTESIPLEQANVEGFDNTIIGKQTITVTYQALSTSFEIEIVEEGSRIEIGFKEDSKYSFDEGEYILNIASNTSLENFKKEIITNGEMKFYDKSTLVVGEDSSLKTGMEMEVTRGTVTNKYKLVVLGDVNGTGTVNVADITTMMMHIAESMATKQDTAKILTGAYLKAADLNNDKNVSLADLVALATIVAEKK